MKLSEGIERYVACKRQGGLLYTATEYGLTSFMRRVGDVELNEVTSDDVLIYLGGPKTSPISWRKKHQQVSQFFVFCSDRGHSTTSPMPRLHDLRYTYAVHRITSWIRKDADLNQMLPALAAYMGHSGLWATERYLLMSPERFRKSLNKLSPTQSRNKWRNDPILMKFLANL
jgi:hypothetical protein